MTLFPLQYPVFRPAMRAISSITRSNPVVITTTIDHGYITGTIVRIDIPLHFGMEQINQQFGPITVTGDDTFTIPIDSTNYTPFVIPVEFPYSYQQAQAVPIGEDNSILTAAVRNVLTPTSI